MEPLPGSHQQAGRAQRPVTTRATRRLNAQGAEQDSTELSAGGKSD
jgi:hypothetical protein